ncbi:hypothetical protein PGT21_033647 [Puccinia graminis f. sp. tritici]|uniref:Uncharacterized protein n=1 Tax=Puccinia graminis f. sp. tritici TaxID=56615 RepID=A0A5B0MGP7_PUCGR|nr:hypothetical protein PGT21_033647 [Puccinia graminis f. sp. tritici]
MISMIFNFFVVLLSVTSSLGAPLSPNRNHLERRFSGQATWFNPALGACGETNSESDMIVAMNQAQKTVSIKNEATGKTVSAKVTDEAIGSLDQGVLPISWQFA